MAKIAKATGIAESTVQKAGKGEPIIKEKAELIAKAAGLPFDKLFEVFTDTIPLSGTSVLSYHRLIHLVLAHAEKEMIVPYNAAEKATPPKKKKRRLEHSKPPN